MKTSAYLWQLAGGKQHAALPILSFPAAQRLGVTVRALVQDSELQAQALAVIAAETPSAASVSLMDLSVEAEAFGAQVRFADSEVPAIIGQLVSSAEEAEALAVPKVGDGRTGVCVQAVRLAKERIQDRPVLAGAIGPYSLTGRLMDVTEIMYLCYDEPETVHTVLRKATEFLIAYCRAFRDAGADGVILAEPLAGLLSAQMCQEFSCTYVKQLIDAVQTEDFAVIYHNCGNAVPQMLEEIYATGAAAYHFGNAVDMERILASTPDDRLCMGNIDPAGLFANGTPEAMREAVLDLLKKLGSRPNFLLSSGCDIPPHAKWENIRAFFAAAQEASEHA